MVDKNDSFNGIIIQEMGLLCRVKVMQRMILTICDKWISMRNNIINTYIY